MLNTPIQFNSKCFLSSWTIGEAVSFLTDQFHFLKVIFRLLRLELIGSNLFPLQIEYLYVGSLSVTILFFLRQLDLKFLTICEPRNLKDTKSWKFTITRFLSYV